MGDEIEILNTTVLELKKELEFREEKDKDFEVLQKIAEDEADTISDLEKENVKVVKALNEMEAIMRKDKEKIKIIEDTLDEERNSMLEKLRQTVCEVDAQKTKYEEMQDVLSAAREDIIKLEQENAKLKEQVTSDFIGITTDIHIMDESTNDDDEDTEDSDTNTIVDD